MHRDSQQPETLTCCLLHVHGVAVSRCADLTDNVPSGHPRTMLPLTDRPAIGWLRTCPASLHSGH